MKIDFKKPLHLTFAVAAVSLLGFGLGYSGNMAMKKPLPPEFASQRAPASSGLRFIERESASKSETKVYPGGIFLTLTSDQATPIPQGGEFTLTARITATQDTDGLNLSWHFSKPLRILSGTDRDTLSLRAGETVVKTLSLKTETARNVRVVAEVGRTRQGARNGVVGQFNTNPDELDPIHRRVSEDRQFHTMGRDKKTKILQ